MAAIVDHIFVMGYDLHGTWDTYADFNAPLYAPSGTSPQSRSSISDCVQAYLKKGIPAEKIVLGDAFGTASLPGGQGPEQRPVQHLHISQIRQLQDAEEELSGQHGLPPVPP